MHQKTLLLARLAFNKKFKLEDVDLTGISAVDIKDIKLAENAGLTLKLSV